MEEAARLAALAQDWPAKLLAYLNARSLSPSADGWRDAALFAGVNPDELEKRAATRAALEKAYKASQAAGISRTALLLDGKPYQGSQRLMPLYSAVNAALPAARGDRARSRQKRRERSVPTSIAAAGGAT